METETVVDFQVKYSDGNWVTMETIPDHAGTHYIWLMFKKVYGKRFHVRWKRREVKEVSDGNESKTKTHNRVRS